MDFFDASGAVIGSAIGGMLASTAGGVAIAEISGVAATNATLAWLGGGVLSVGGFGMVGGMAVFGGLVAGPALAIFGAISADEMKEKLEKAKAYHSQVEAAVKKADVMIDNLLAIERVVKLFTRQITKCDALFFSLSQDAIATMKKHHYDTSRYNQKEKDQLCVTVSTLSSLSAFLKVPIMDEHQRHDEKTQLRSLSLQPRRKGSALRCGFNPHDFERFFESPHHRRTPKAPREGEKGFGDHDRADG